MEEFEEMTIEELANTVANDTNVRGMAAAAEITYRAHRAAWPNAEEIQAHFDAACAAVEAIGKAADAYLAAL